MVQLFCGNVAPQKSFFQPIQNDFGSVKAYGGLWTSTYHPDYGSDWVRAYHQMWGVPQDGLDGWIVTPRADARLYTVDSLEDLQKLFENYQLPSIERPDHEIFSWLFRKKVLDYEKMAEDYDGLHLTFMGQVRTRHTIPYSLYTWDCECTHWFHWCFEKVEYVGKVKHL